MQIKRREQRDRIPQSKVLEDRYLLPRSIISTTTTSHSQRSLLNRSIDSSGKLTFFTVTGALLTQRPQISACSATLPTSWCSASSVGTSHLRLYSTRLSAFEYFALLSISRCVVIVCNGTPEVNRTNRNSSPSAVSFAAVPVLHTRLLPLPASHPLSCRTRLLNDFVHFATHFQQLVPDASFIASLSARPNRPSYHSP